MDRPRAAREQPFDDAGARRWRRRPVLSRLLRGGVLLVPVLAAVGVAAGFAAVMPSATGAGRVGWWMVVLGVALLALVVLDTVARRLLPLAALLRLTLLFPDRAPSRLRVALRGTSRVRLQAWAAQTTRPSAATDVDAGERARQILSLAAALHAHDRMTRGHSERVRALTELVAEELRLTDDEADRLQWAALLHDIGKLSVPAEILNKPGKPDDAEWAVLRRHPAEGARIAAPLHPWLGEWADAVAQHHERFDGTGYPEGLSGERISLAGRIVSVTDAFETMTALRSYKRPMSAGAARTELARCAGTHFDPRVVRAFLSVSLGRLHWSTGGALAWVAVFPPAAAVARVGTRISGAFARPAAATKATAAVGVIVLGGLLAAQSSVPGGSGAPVAAADEARDRIGGPTNRGAARNDMSSSVASATQPAPAPAAPSEAPVPDGAAGAVSAPVATPTPAPAPGVVSGPVPAPVPGPAPPPPPPVDSAPPAPAPPAPDAPDSSTRVDVGPIGITLLPTPSVQIGDIITIP
ncbi:MAG: HD-GYP domain-containing protein [Acidimicrobiia bacterium]